MHILVVEDERVLRQNIESFLKQRGHTVYCAWTVEGAMKSLRIERDIDVVILDIFINGGDSGREMGGLRIAGRVPRDTPIIVISGGDEETIRIEAERNPLMGVVHWVAKPFPLSTISDLLEGMAYQ